MIIESAMEVHKELGPVLMESVYEHCLLKVLKEKEIPVQSQVRFPIIFRGEKLDKEFIIDVLVDDMIILELKAIENILPVHEAQLLSYLKLSGKKLGLLINFNSALLKNGIKRRVNGDLNL
jgi:GxxExxY protein